MSAHTQPTKRITVPDFVADCFGPVPTPMITAYDASSAAIAEAAGVSGILVGDSLACVMRGESDTRQVTVDEMIYHTKIVVRNTQRPLVVADMPYGDFQCSVEAACRAGVRLWKESGCGAIKVEGGARMARTVEALIQDTEIPIMGHVGLRPQASGILGGFKAQGKTMASRARIKEDFLAMQEAGCFSIVVEGVDLSLADELLAVAQTPIISIGGTPKSHGQILVFHDVVGLTQGPKAKFAQAFADAYGVMKGGVQAYVEAVRGGTYPDPDKHCYHLKVEPAAPRARAVQLYGPNGQPLPFDR